MNRLCVILLCVFGILLGLGIEPYTACANVQSQCHVDVLSDLPHKQDRRNLIAEQNAPSSLLRAYMWGLDLSGTIQGAGGVGGLLLFTSHQPLTTSLFACYDGNGNVAALLHAPSSALQAVYEYGPFGELIRATGPMSKTNPFRWSTKFWDEETGLVYYGARYYSPSLGRFINRDPIEEEGGLNLFTFLANDGINYVDPSGLMTADLLLGSSESGGMYYQNAASIFVAGGLATTLAAAIVVNNNLRQAFLASALESDDIDYAIAIESGAREAISGGRLLSKNYGEGLIKQIDVHIGKLVENYPGGGSPDPNDPRDRLMRKWKNDLKIFIGEVRKAMYRMPKNRIKREPYEAAIKRAEETIQKYGGL